MLIKLLLICLLTINTGMAFEKDTLAQAFDRMAEVECDNASRFCAMTEDKVINTDELCVWEDYSDMSPELYDYCKFIWNI